jgi:hypothetical protein
MREFTRLNLFAGLLAFLFMVSSCKEDKLGDPIIVSNIKKEFYLDVSEILGPGQRTTQFKVQTIEDGECLNGSIDFDFTHVGNRLTVLLKDVVIPEDCIPGIAPSTADVTAGALNAGFYLFNFNLRNTVNNKGTLIVEDNRYLLELETEEGVILLHKEVFRVPENSIWGYLAYSEASQESDVRDFYEQISFHGVDPGLENGYYGFFTINSAAPNIELNNPPEAQFYEPFILNYDGDWAFMKALVQDLSATYPEVSVKMFDDKGRSY